MSTRSGTSTAQPPGRTAGRSGPPPRRRTRLRTVVVALAAGTALIAGLVFAARTVLREHGGDGDGAARPSGGVFVTAKSSGAVIGEGGRPRRFKVQVEKGTDVDPERAAAEISAILADRRGWTRDGRHSFRLVSGDPSDFQVKIATPATVDRICGEAGLDTHGEVNCDAGTQIMVNLKRWNTGSPEFSGPIGGYRALIINHEVGHRIGHGHEGCPGKGKRAPVMMQQIYGLKGCVANEWPYNARGRYIGGPAVP
ncbi:DUF3152 domain-containing protein [Streptomyces cuspidosporus]|uniref:DUF3152 domain-containing protein n=1 Tax=Streptomyces cuspidosporus TaxID=66882 RepID=A0ABP5SFZ7_9ACTN